MKTQSLRVVGIDLCGPRNVADTSAAMFEQRGDTLYYLRTIQAAGDQEIYELVSDAGKQATVVVGIDAPLSYNPGGGDLPSDTELRHLVLQKGRVGVMSPTLIRMMYLTLRGLALTRMLEGLREHSELRIVEVHPGAAMLLRGANANDVGAFKMVRFSTIEIIPVGRVDLFGSGHAASLPDLLPFRQFSDTLLVVPSSSGDRPVSSSRSISEKNQTTCPLGAPA